jgi:Tol biopolymer transport system component
MRRLRSLRVLVAALALVPVMAAGAVLKAGSSRAASPGLIVFASDRAKANPGEIYSLAPGTAPRDVSRSLAGDYGLAVAPVGDLIAFWSARSGTERVYLARGDGSQLRLVHATRGDLFAESGGNGGLLAFSADAAVLVAVQYTASRRSGIAAHLWLVDTRSATARPIRLSCDGINQPAPDGRLIACGRKGATSVYDTSGRLHFTLPGASPVWSSRGWLATSSNAGGSQTDGSAVVADASGRTVGRLKGRALGWSPDGRLLVFARARSLWAADARDLARPRKLLANWENGGLSFTPDGRFVSVTAAQGKPVLVPLAGGPPIAGLDRGLGVWSRSGRVAYIGYADAYGDIRPGVTVPVLVSDTHGRNPRVVGRFPFDDHALSELHWLPGGRRVLFLTSTSCGVTDLFAVPANGGAARRLTHDPRDLQAPSWSPDGSAMAYSVEEFACHLGAGLPKHLEIVDAQGAGSRRVTDDGDRNLGSFDSDPAFSPDGTQIAFDHGTFNDVSLQVVAAAGGERTTLVPPGTPWPGAPAWSPDGAKIAYVSGASIMVIAPAGGTPEVLAQKPGQGADACEAGGIAWSPDGTQLAVGGDGGIYLVTLAAPASAVLAIPARCAEYPSFSPDGTRIAFDAQPAGALGNQTAIMVANADGSGVRTLSTVPFRQSVHPSWQPA